MKSNRGVVSMVSAMDAGSAGTAPIFRSTFRLALTTGDAPLSATHDEWIRWLDDAERRGEIHKDERDWSSVDSWLDSREAATRDEVCAYVEAHSVVIDEVMLREGAYAARLSTRRFGDLADDEQHRVPGYLFGRDDSIVVYDGDWPIYLGDEDQAGAIRAAVEAAVDADTANTGEARYATNQMPGGSHYRELLLILRDTEERNEGVFRSSRYLESNILVHARFNERVDAGGQRVLFIEDVQSDWHRAGSTHGYRKGRDSGSVGAGESIDQDASEDAHAVPAAPFQRTEEWVILAMKRLVRYAVERGIDRIAWTPGDMQASRYDMGFDVTGLRAFYDDTMRHAVAAWIEPFGGSVDRHDVSFGDPDPLPWKLRDATDAGDGSIESAFATEGEADASANETGGVFLTYEPGGHATVHGFEVTPALRAAALVGFPLFSVSKGSQNMIDKLFDAARAGTLPPDFDQWALADKRGWTVAHVAAYYGHLPPAFDQWALADEVGRTVAHAAARYGHLPPDFDQWDLADDDGWTVAHASARYGHLPPDFDQWDLADDDGITVARFAARHGHLTPGFDQWALADKRGWTVAHVAAYYGHLPPAFDQWDLADNSGYTVAHQAARFGHLPPAFDQWALADEVGRTVAHEAARYGRLPPDFDQWDLADDDGWTVAEVAADHGHLPDGVTVPARGPGM